MGLGNRTARHHDTVVVHTAGVDPSDFWVFKPGQAVMTVDGFSGKVTAVNDGRGTGAESYEVTLDKDMGGGEYTASQLTAKNDPAVKTAADDYPELGSILEDRPDIAPNQRWATMSATAGRDYDDHPDGHDQCPECGSMVNTNTASMRDHLRDEHEADPDDYSKGDQFSAWEKHATTETPAEPGVDEHGHLTWDGNSPACRDTDEYSMFGQNDAVEKQAAAGDSTPEQWVQHRQNLEQKRTQDDAVRASGPCQSCGGGDHTTNEHMGWAEQKHNEGTHDAWGRPKMQPYDGHGAWSCNNYECSEHPQSMYPEDGQLQGTPGWLTHDAGPDADMRREVNKAMSPHDTQDANWLLSQQHEGPTHLSSRTAKEYGPSDFGQTVKTTFDASPSQSTPCLRYPGTVHSDGEKCDCFHGGKPGHWASKSDSWSIVTMAAADPDFRFHVTAAWSDVRSKAKKIRAQGGVHVTLATAGMVVGEVQGEHNVYESGIQRMPGRTAIQAWSCGCKWGAYHWGANDDFSRFAGRMCSHALALQYEAQSRGMFGKDVYTDDAKPTWVPRMVVVKHDIDAQRDVTGPATKVGSLDTVMATVLSRVTDAPEDVRLAFLSAGIDYDDVLRSYAAINDAWGEPEAAPAQYGAGPTKPRDPGENPASAGFASAPEPEGWGAEGPSGTNHMVASRRYDICSNCGEHIHDASGVDENVPWVHANTSNAMCDVQSPSDAVLLAGSPLDRPEANPILHEAALDDDAMFEPEMPKEAFLPLLLMAPELLAGAAEIGGAGAAAAGAGEAAAAGGAAAAGEGAAAAGAGEAAGGGLSKVVPKVLNQVVKNKMMGPAGPQGPSGPKGGPARQGEHPMNDDSTDSLNYGARADLHEQPEGALPSTDGADGDDDLFGSAGDTRAPGDGAEPESLGFASTGSVQDIVEAFQATAGAQAIQTGSGPQGGSSDGMDLAAAAREHLNKTALKDFSAAERAQIINEGEGVRHGNTDRLNIKGTHYEPLEAALAAADDDEEWMA